MLIDLYELTNWMRKRIKMERKRKSDDINKQTGWMRKIDRFGEMQKSAKRDVDYDR